MNPRSHLVLLLMIWLASGPCGCCRSKVDEDRETFQSKHGTEPPEPEHHRPERAVPAASDAANPNQAVDPDDPSLHEAGEVKVGKKWEFPVAVTKKGMLWGSIEESRLGKRILAFRGIRHLQPPVDALRWKPPVPSAKWDGIVEAKFNGHVCPQHMFFKPDIWIGNEDCLWLNVFTRDLVVGVRRPVIVWIHGGNFVRGSAADYDPDYILDEDVVLVTIQYRLGMFGFLSTEDGNAPGNYGMLDQVAALQWVKQNIEAFTGDPNNIMIMGQQAGGASVHYHILSPMSRGLFHKAVSLSGSALCWWASIKRPLEKAKKLARLQKCPYNKKSNDDDLATTKAMIDCLRQKDMESLMNSHPNFYEWRHLEQSQEPITAFSPRVDPDSSIPFMPQEPIDLMKQGNFQHLPWIIGITDDEGAVKAASLFADPKAVPEFLEQFEKLGPLVLGFHDGQTEAPKVNAAKIRDHYWGQNLDQSNIQSLSNAISDSSYAHPVDTAAKIHAMKSMSSVFVYHFGYRGQNSFAHLQANQWPPKVMDTKWNLGAANGDDLIYLFPVLSGTFRPLPHDDLIFSQRFLQLFVNFARSGKPYIQMSKEGDEVRLDDFEWYPAMANNASHLNIGAQMSMDMGLPNHDRMNFWQQMPAYWNSDRANYKPAPPILFKDEL